MGGTQSIRRVGGTFGEVVDTMEISRRGSLRPRSRFARLTTAEPADVPCLCSDGRRRRLLDLPRPGRGASPSSSIADAADHPSAALKQELVAQVTLNRLRSQKGPEGGQRARDPTDGKAGPGRECSQAKPPTFPESKVNALAAKWPLLGRTEGRVGRRCLSATWRVHSDARGLLATRRSTRTSCARGIPQEQMPPSGKPIRTARSRPCPIGRGAARSGTRRQHAEEGHRHERCRRARSATSPPRRAWSRRGRQREGVILRQATRPRRSPSTATSEEGVRPPTCGCPETKDRFISQVMTARAGTPARGHSRPGNCPYAEVKPRVGNRRSVTLARGRTTSLQRLAP